MPKTNQELEKIEHVVLVSEQDEELGLAEKATVHTTETPLHRAFSLFLFNSHGELLLQQRAHHKKTWPGIWSNSVCGHPQRGESYTAAAQRRLAFELGLNISAADIHMMLPNYRYRYQHKGVVENEFCPVMAVFTDVEPKPNAEEVADTRWIPWQQFLSDIQHDNDYSEWCVEEAQLLQEKPEFRNMLADFTSQLSSN
jgi:isopentenyl-diphosphate delta-isomerase